MDEIRRQARISYLDRKLRDYANWAPRLRLEAPDVDPEEVYRRLAKELEELDVDVEPETTQQAESEAGALPASRIPPWPEGEEVPLPDWRKLGQMKITPSDVVAWKKFPGLVVIPRDCDYPDGLDMNVQVQFDDTEIAVDKEGGSTFVPAPSTSKPESQGYHDLRLKDEKSFWPGDSPDAASGLIELRVDLPKSNCAAWIVWFTEVHLKAMVDFGANLESGLAYLGWGMRTDITNQPGDPLAINVPSLETQVSFIGGDWSIASSESEVIIGDGTPWETTFRVLGAQRISAGETLTLRFYAEGVVNALGGVTRLYFSQGIYDSWAIQNESGFIESVRGVRYMMFRPGGFVG